MKTFRELIKAMQDAGIKKNDKVLIQAWAEDYEITYCNADGITETVYIEK